MTKRIRIPVSDPRAQYLAFRDEIDSAIAGVLRGGNYILGSEVHAFEAEFAQYVGVAHSIGVASGTDAIAIALRALGIGAGDEVITVAHTAVATVAGIEQAGATPVLVDVEPGYLTMDPDRLPEVLSDRTKAVMPVHLYGQPADLDRIGGFCDKHGLTLVEDASQAHGARLHERVIGSFGDAAVFSCYPTKNLGALGDAGMITTDDPMVAERASQLRQYGWAARNNSQFAGVNSRLDEIQASVLRVKLRHLDANNGKRRRIAELYQKMDIHEALVSPRPRPDGLHVFHQYVTMVEDRPSLQLALHDAGVETAIHYPIPVHLQGAYRDRLRHTSMPVTEMAAGAVLSLPMYPEMVDDDVEFVMGAVHAALARRLGPSQVRS